MSQTSNRPRSCPFPMRWLRAGSDPARSAHALQCTECPLAHSEPVLRCPSCARGIVCTSVRRSHPPCARFTTKVGGRIKSPLRPLPCRCQTSRDFVPWRFLDADGPNAKHLIIAGVQKPAQEETLAINSCIHLTAAMLILYVAIDL